MNHQIQLDIQPQPDDTTCGPTCLHAVYRFLGDPIALDQTIAEVRQLEEGGTLAVMLGLHALKRGYRARIYTNNLTVFDPTWFVEAPGESGATDPTFVRPSERLGQRIAERLRSQLEVKEDPKLRVASQGYIEFLERGGEVLYRDLTASLLRQYLRDGIPVLTGLSATHLYRCARELEDDYDDLRGTPMGHFVVLSGYDRESGHVTVADPLQDNPAFGGRYYEVDVQRIVAAILLGVVTYDANLLVIQKGDADRTPGKRMDRR